MIVETSAYTLVGMHYGEIDEIYEILKQKSFDAILKRNSNFENAIEVYSKSKLSENFIKLGVLGTNRALPNTKSGAECKIPKDLILCVEVQVVSETKHHLDFEDEMRRSVTHGSQLKINLKTNGYIPYSLKQMEGFKRHFPEIVSVAAQGNRHYFELKDYEEADAKKDIQSKQNENINLNGEKEKKTMKKNFLSKFGADFNYPTSNFAVSLFGGGLAVKTKDGFVTFDGAEAVDAMEFVIEDFNDFIMIMPAQTLEDGDIFVQNGEVYQMITAAKGEAYSYDKGAIVNLVTKKNPFGFQMYAKVLNLMGNLAATGTENSMFGGMNPMMMMMMMNGKDEDSNMPDMMKMMMMSQMFAGAKKG